tara:strand:- start:101 stop:673 length:573 start_codon:yes stop_codon:yes gene_type:complete
MAKDRPFKDKMLSRAPAGYWMTQDMKATPQKFVDPEDALQSIIDGLNVPENRNKTKAYIYAGIPVSTIAETIAITGYAENQFNPDVAELIKPAVNIILTDIALEDDFMGPFRLTPQPTYQEDIDEVELENTMMNLMQEENPQLAKLMQMKQDEDYQEELKVREEEIVKRQQKANSPAPTGGFITRDEESV